MLKLLYNIKCGFKDLYITEKNCEYDFSDFCTLYSDDALAETLTEEELYNSLKDLDKTELEEYFNECGILDTIAEITQTDYAHTYFKEICFADPEHPCIPSYVEIYNLRVIYDNTIKVDFMPDSPNTLVAKYTKTTLKAKDVMAILRISRQTLSRYVKRGLLNPTMTPGGQYRYSSDEVYKLKRG